MLWMNIIVLEFKGHCCYLQLLLDCQDGYLGCLQVSPSFWNSSVTLSQYWVSLLSLLHCELFLATFHEPVISAVAFSGEMFVCQNSEEKAEL